jgi:hypothetical protein
MTDEQNPNDAIDERTPPDELDALFAAARDTTAALLPSAPYLARLTDETFVRVRREQLRRTERRVSAIAVGLALAATVVLGLVARRPPSDAAAAEMMLRNELSP